MQTQTKCCKGHLNLFLRNRWSFCSLFRLVHLFCIITRKQQKWHSFETFFPILAVCQRFCAVGCFQYLKFEPSVIVSNIWIFDCFQDLNIWAPFGCFWYLNIWAPFSCFQYLDIWAHFVVSNIWNLSLPAWWGWSWSRLFLDHNCFPLLPMARRGQTCHEISK